MFKALNNKHNSHVAQLQKIHSKMNRNPHKAHQQFTLISVSPSVHPLRWSHTTDKSRGAGPCPGPADQHFQGNWEKTSPGALSSLRKHFGRCPGAQGQLSGLGWAGTEQEGTSPALLAPAGTQGQGRAGTQGQEPKGRVLPKHTQHLSPAGLQGHFVNISWDRVSLLRASKGACAIILRTDWECKPNTFFSSLSKSDDQLWL